MSLRHDTIFDSDPLEVAAAIATSHYIDAIVTLIVHSRRVKDKVWYVKFPQRS